MCSNGNSFGNGASADIAAPESNTREGFPLLWGWQGVQSPGNAL